MKSDEPSRMAVMVARQRAAHQLLDHGAILDDPYAVRILGEPEDNIVQAVSKHPLMSMGRLFTAARSRIAEDALSKAVERGVRQVVILGAGLDTFALRNPHGTRISIFEVDHPATQAWKRQRLAEAELAPPPWLTFVPNDFERDDLQQKLSSAGFQHTSAAFFTWLGVVPYLTRNAIDDTLGYIASIPNSEVVFDYSEPPEAWTGDVKAHAAARMAQLEKINEQWVSGLTPTDVAAILRSHSFVDMEDISFQQIVSRFGRDVQGLASGQIGVHVVHAKH
ncbi:MAG TPA: class I SAM-dependent methyltransferase [Terriglobales bacterium]|nr:class I SAM-dependent methyltransferase [Terriglobales bacterium]